MRRETKESQLNQLNQLEPKQLKLTQAPQFQKQLILAMSVESHKFFVSEHGCLPKVRDKKEIADQMYELAVKCGISPVFKHDIKNCVIKTLTRLNRIKNTSAGGNKKSTASAATKPPEIQSVKAESAGQEEERTS
jgi:hypothetical protein